MSRLNKIWISLATGVGCSTAQAYMFNMPMPGPNLMVTAMITQRALQEQLTQPSSSAPLLRKTAPTTSGSSGKAINGSRPNHSVAGPLLVLGDARAAKKIAAHYPPGERAAAERLFDDLLVKYRQLARQLGQSPDDLGASVAALLAASHMVYTSTEFPDSQFAALAAQMRAVMQSSSEFMAAAPESRREMHEEAAILAMFLAGTKLAVASAPSGRQANEISINMRAAAKSYLEALVGVSADRVQISASGLEVSPP